MNTIKNLYEALLDNECPECKDNLKDPIDIFSDIVVLIFGTIAIITGITLLAINL